MLAQWVVTQQISINAQKCMYLRIINKLYPCICLYDYFMNDLYLCSKLNMLNIWASSSNLVEHVKKV